MIIDTTQTKTEKTLDWIIQKRDKFLELKCSIGYHICANRDISYYGVPSKLRFGFRCACGMDWTIRVGELRRWRSYYPEIRRFWDGGEDELKKFASRLNRRREQ